MSDKVQAFMTQADGFRWKGNNCDLCDLSHVPQDGEKYGAIEQMRTVMDGRECELKYAIDRSIWNGFMYRPTAEQVGVDNKGLVGTTCKAFVPQMHLVGEPQRKSWRKRFLERIGLLT